MSQRSPKDLGAAIELLLTIAVLLAIVGTGIVVLVWAR
jgi:hypothetical protein